MIILYHTVLLYIGTTNFNTAKLWCPTSETIEHWKSLK